MTNRLSDAWRRIVQRGRAHPRAIVASSVVLTLVVCGGLAFALARGGGSTPASPDTLTIEPGGTAVPRLAPVVVHFPQQPGQTEGARLVSLQPAVPGQYAWLDDQTLLFQPDYPGLVRGSRYTVTVDAHAAGLTADATQAFTVEGKLTVDHVIPSDGNVDVPAGAHVLVQFSRSVAPLTTLDAQDATPPVKFDPPLAGAGRWLNTSLYEFVPTDLQPSTTYHVTVPAGLTSASDGVLDADYSWSFSTYRPAVAKSDPADNTQFMAPDQVVSLTFNQPMDRTSIEHLLAVTDASGAAVAGAITWSDQDTVVHFTPSQPWALSTRYTVTVPAGVAGAAGGATATERTITFRTVDPPRIVSTTPADGETAAGRYGVQIEFNNPVDVESLQSRVAISGIAPDDLQVMEGGPNGIYVGVKLQPSTHYTVSIAAGAVDRSGQPIPAASFAFTTGALPPSISFAVPSWVATYSATTDAILYARVTNLDHASFALYRLSESDANGILDTNQLPKTGGLWTPPSAPIRTWDVPVDGGQDATTLISTSLGDGAPLPAGEYYVASTNGAVYSQLMVSVVDTAMVTKLSQDQLLVWALDYATGKPVAGATVTASGPGLSGAAATAQTDASGLATFTVPSPRDVSNKERAYVAHLDDQGRHGVASTRWTNGAQPWQLGLPVDYYQRQYVAYLYTDRPIYRPGETVSYKVIVRADDDASYSVPSPAPALQLVVHDPQYSDLETQDVTLNDLGTWGGTLSLAEGAATGQYSLELRVTGTGNQFGPGYESIGGTAFQVAEFRNPEFQVAVSTDRDRYVNGQTIDGAAQANFFFGGALAAAPVTWAALASPTYIQSKDFPGYSFNDFDYARTTQPQQPLRAQGTATTDAAGKATFQVPAVLQGDEGPQQFTVSATVTDQNQQQVADSTTVTVDTGAVYPGVKPAEYIAKSGQAAEIDVASVDPTGAALPRRDVVVRVYERDWVTTKVQTADGGKHYVSEPKDTLVATLPVTTGADATASVTYTPAKTGELRIVASATDDSGRTSKSSTQIWVAGTEFASWQVRNDDVLPLVADRDSYDVGDTAQVLVPSAFEGATGLVTIERGKIISKTTRAFPTTAETLSIPITDQDVPNVFVGVVLYRPPTAADPLPRYQVGYVELHVSTASRHLDVTITPSTTQAQPGDTVDYHVHVADAAGKGVQSEFSIAVVDKAVLSLAQEVGPDGLHAFWYERGLGVATASSLAVSIDRANDAIPESQAGGKGGGGESNALRSDFRNTADWEAQVATDANGDATVSVKLPDTLTTWRADVRAVDGGTRIGEATAEVVSTQPLLLRPALPRFLRVGDDVGLRMLVTNTTQQASDVSVQLNAGGVNLTGDATQTAHVAAGETATLAWSAQAKAAGTAHLAFTATGSGGLSDGVALDVPVLVDLTPETTATGGELDAGATSEAVYLPEWAVTDGGSLSVSVQASLAGSLGEELTHLAPQPYETVERKASRVVATIAAHRAAGGSVVDDQVRSDVAALVGLQHVDGGWGWCADCDSSPAMSAWVLVALGDAQAAGVNVNADAVARGQTYVSSQAGQASDVADPMSPNDRAYLYSAIVQAAGGATGSSSGAATATATATATPNLPPPPEGKPTKPGAPPPVGVGLGVTANAQRAASSLRAIVDQDRSQLTNWGRAWALLGLVADDRDEDQQPVQSLITDLSSSAVASATGAHWEDRHGTAGYQLVAAMQSNLRTTALVVQALSASQPGHALLPEAVRWLTSARTAKGWSTSLERAQAVRALSAYAVASGETAANYSYRVALGETSLLDGTFNKSTAQQAATKQVPLTDLQQGAVNKLAFTKSGSGRLYYALDLRYLTPAARAEALNQGFAVSHTYTLLDAQEAPVQQAALGDTVRVEVTVVVPADRNFVTVEDALPAGLEPVDTSLATTDPALKQQLEEERRQAATAGQTDQVAPWYRWYYSPWSHVDVRDDRVVLAAQRLPAGVYTYVYYARATAPGTFFVAPPHAEETYFPEVFGRGDSGTFTVK